jgi:HlyD family secretion protein
MAKTSPLSTLPPHSPTAAPKSGAGMDKQVIIKKSPWKTAKLIITGVVSIGLFVPLLADIFSGRGFQISENRIVVSTVELGNFEDFIPLRCRVTPLKTVFLDAIEGGRIESVPVEDGTLLKKGDLIAELSNSALQLNVNRNEALVTEQLNNMRTIELQLEQNRLAHKRTLIDTEYEIKRLTREVMRERLLIKNKAISQSKLEQTEDELEYAIRRKEITLESQSTDARLQESQLKSLKAANIQLNQNLAYAQKNLESLNIRAPVDGKLSGFNVEVGQSISPGGRLGQINDPKDYKLTALIDEFYLSRVDLGQTASFESNGIKYTLRTAKIYPQVVNGQFEVDFVFTEDQPNDIRRGQTLQTQLTLGDTAQAIVIPNGAFYQETGGNWVFVVTPQRDQAVKRSVRLGRRNARYIEVLEGLELGEKIITSPYTSFLEMDRLTLKSKS